MNLVQKDSKLGSDEAGKSEIFLASKPFDCELSATS
jgi:hypothetical protein